MASRITRQFSIARSITRPSKAVRAFGRRMMSSATPPPKNDLPLIFITVGITVPTVFYILSTVPKGHEAHGKHEEKHEKKEEIPEAPAAVEMTDDEGKTEDVSEALATATAEDVPKAEPAAETPAVPAESIPEAPAPSEEQEPAEPAKFEDAETPKEEETAKN